MADEQEQERIRQILNESFASSVEDVVIDNSDNDEEDIVEDFMEQTDTEQEGEYSEEDMEEDHQHEQIQPRFPCYIVKDRITRWRIHCPPARSELALALSSEHLQRRSLQKNLPTEIRQRRQEVAGTSAQVEKAISHQELEKGVICVKATAKLSIVASTAESLFAFATLNIRALWMASYSATFLKTEDYRSKCFKWPGVSRGQQVPEILCSLCHIDWKNG
ncbi:hypothetical protein J6590_042527 [Homalodisca vitripennis]|nr:hypothetical protein J6590_042527 [Homalodisca vitripennis]